MSRLERTLQLNMVGVIQTTLSTLLNLAILAELPRDGLVWAFFGFERLLHCVRRAEVCADEEKASVGEKRNFQVAEQEDGD